MASRQQINLIKMLALKRGLDPRAVLAVARQEGLGGGIGDQGTSFGPFQLHEGGALPSGIKGNRQAWAWSPAGLSYALDRIQSVASGLHGAEAVRNIVTRFERPADPTSEIAGALSAYGGGGGAPSIPYNSPATNPATPAYPNANTNPLLQAVLRGGDLLPVIRRNALQGSSVGLQGPLMAPKALPYQSGTPTASGGLNSSAIPFQALPGVLGQTVPAELLSEGTGGPTHSTGPHIHVAYTSPQAVLAAIRLAESLGLHVGENPYVGSIPASGVHAKNSYHYRYFPGKYNGKTLGEAIDVSGPKSQQFYSLLKRRK